MYVLRIPRWVAQSAIGVGLVLSLTAVFAARRLTEQACAGGRHGAAQMAVCPAGYSGSAETGVRGRGRVRGVQRRLPHVLTACENTAGSRTCGGCTENSPARNIGCFDAKRVPPTADCSSRLTLGFEDAMPPVITTSGDVTVAASSAKGAVAKFTATAKDKIDGERPVACTPASGSTFPVGKTTVSCWSSNSLGKLKTSSLTVTVTQ